MSAKRKQTAFSPEFIIKGGKNGAAEAVFAAESGAEQNEPLNCFAERLYARADAESLSFYSEAERKKAAALAVKAIAEWRPGEAVVHFDKDCLTVKWQDGNAAAEKISVLTLVNTNKPFLFDSVLAEIYGGSRPEIEGAGSEYAAAESAEAAPAVYLVAHPVFTAMRGQDGSLAVALSPGGAAPAEEEKLSGGKRLSVIQIHLKLRPGQQSKKLVAALRNVTAQVRAVFHDRKPIEEILTALKAAYASGLPRPYRPQLPQVLAFLDWLQRGNFVFLGLREYARAVKAGKTELLPAGAELGILTDASIRILRNPESLKTTKEILSFMESDDLMLVTKARTRSSVHRTVFLDYIGLKLFDDTGAVRGELRLVGLFTANAYHASVLDIPYLKPKAEAIIAALGYDKADHSGRALLHILESYPRDDMFRLSEAELTANAARILSLSELPRPRVLSNADRFGHFVSLLVFIPRDRYNTQTRRAIGAAGLRLYGGDFYEYAPRFFDKNLTRIHYVIHRQSGAAPAVPAAEIEAEIAALISSWSDKITALAKAEQTAKEVEALALALPQGYRDMFSPRAGLRDAAALAGLSAAAPLSAEFVSAEEEGSAAGAASNGRLFLKLFHYGRALELSRRVPILENMGFRTIAERTVEIPAARARAAPLFMHDMELVSCGGSAESKAQRRNLAALFAAVWAGAAADDGFNGLAQAASFSLPAISVLRAYGRYLQQAGIPYSQDRLAAGLNRYPALAQALYRLFCLRFDPQLQTAKTAAEQTELEAAMERDLQNVPSLDDDRIIRAFANLITATLRANMFAPPAAKGARRAKTDSAPGKTLAFKFDPHKIDYLPEPRPYREIFVYGPQVEGVHLRFGPVARGGIRWSDRGQDYRTEVLGLVKAQQVKNAVIVPVGAKGGFYPHSLPQADKAAQQAAGLAAYKDYIGAMLSITDNIEGGALAPAPAAPVRHDGDDPYFVVAADKGTASFSDTANALAQAEHFWLDDAFASGGSEGYDHKKMGITAKGAWEAVKRHFREMNHNIQEEPFTAAGVGDMSGDVFGNGMLLSAKTKLIAAFDHRDIFIDPEPDCAASYAERARLFALPRSSWQDYDKSKISAGGGVFSRADKLITLSVAAAKSIGFHKTSGTPYEIMSAILRAPVDLLFFGGIGTYIRGSAESDAQAGDRANDAVRITGAAVRAKVVGEGANLGMTQNGRVEYAFNGGCVNTDAIDNSAGVNCSDIEVNIKIAFAAAFAAGRLTRPARNAKLKAMTAEVTELILRNNYQQTLALSLGQRRAQAFLPAQIRFMNNLEKRGLLDRTVEALPDNRILAERQEKGIGLTRPELAVLIAYAKNTLEAELVKSGLVADSYCEEALFSYFPHSMRKEFAEEIRGHRLRRDIIATVLANDIVNRGGATFVSRLQDKTGQSAEDVLRAYIVVRDGFSLPPIYAEIDALDNKIDGAAQNIFYDALSKMIFGATEWVLRNVRTEDSLRARVALVKAVYHAALKILPELLSDYWRERLEKAAKLYAERRAPAHLALLLSRLELAGFIPDIVLIAREAGSEVTLAARVYFACGELFGLPQLEEIIAKLPIADYYDGLAVERAQNMLAETMRKMSVFILRKYGTEAQPVAAWAAESGGRAGELAARIKLMRTKDISVSRLTIAAGALADLAADCCA